MAQRESAQQPKHVSQPLIDEYSGIDDIDEPVTVGAWRPVVTSKKGGSGSGRMEDYSRNSASYVTKKKRRVTATQVLAGILIALVVGVGGYAAYQFFKESYKESVNEQLRPENVADAQAAREVLTPTTSREPFYMMIIGTDTREDEDIGERSDTNIVARVDPQAGIISMISIPRDTAILLEGYGTQKFNAAFAYDGIPGAIKAAEGLLGVKISHYALVDFAGMVSLVDAIGGVTVDVPVYIDDPDAGPVTVDAGIQHLDGEHALVFARSRAYVTGDFQRTTNQRSLISAMLNQAMTLSTTDLPRVIESAAECMTTDMSVTMIQDYALYFMNFEEITVYSAMVPSSTAMSEGASYVVCDTVTLQKVMQAINNNEDPSEYLNDFTVSTSAEAEEQGMGDAIGIDSRLLEEGEPTDPNAGWY